MIIILLLVVVLIKQYLILVQMFHSSADVDSKTQHVVQNVRVDIRYLHQPRLQCHVTVLHHYHVSCTNDKYLKLLLFKIICKLFKAYLKCISSDHYLI